MGIASGDIQIASGKSTRNDEGPSFNAVRDDAMTGAVQFADTFYSNRRSACALNLRAHGVEQCSEVGDLGLAGAVLQEGFTIGKSGCHEQVFCARDGDS